MKRDYIKPAVRVCVLQQQCHILAGSGGSETMSTLNTNIPELDEEDAKDELIYGGGGSFEAR